MKNVQLSVKDNTLTITVDLTKAFGPSSSGKTIIVASTEGNFPLPGREEVVGLNVYGRRFRYLPSGRVQFEERIATILFPQYRDILVS